MSDETNKLADEIAAEDAGSADVTVGPDDETVDAASLSAAEPVSEESVAESTEDVEQPEPTAPSEENLVEESPEQAGDEEVGATDEHEAAEPAEASQIEEAEVEEDAIADDETAEEADETAEEGDAEEGDADAEGADAEEDDAEDADAEEVSVEETIADEEEAESEEIKMDWYILKVQSNREKSITAALKRKIAVEGLEDYFGEVVVPVEKVTEFKGGKKKVVNRKLYPGYIVVNMHINDDTWFAVRETSGIGDFTGSGGKPTPMLPSEVARIIQTEEEETEDAPKLNISFKIGDRVKVNDGNFESFEGEVNAIDEHSGRITVMINIFGRSTPVELEYWQVEQA